jgi:glutathione S-transferase
MGKVPAIRHNGRVVTESAAICAYLADACPEAGLAPRPDDPARGDYYRWLFFTAGPFDQAFSLRALKLEVPEGGERVMGCGRGDAVLDTIETAVSASEFLAGPTFTAADLYVAAHLRFGVAFKIFESRPAFDRYVDRICSRPASLRAAELDDALAATLAPAAPN